MLHIASPEIAAISNAVEIASEFSIRCGTFYAFNMYIFLLLKIKYTYAKIDVKNAVNTITPQHLFYCGHFLNCRDWVDNE